MCLLSCLVTSREYFLKNFSMTKCVSLLESSCRMGVLQLHSYGYTHYKFGIVDCSGSISIALD